MVRLFLLRRWYCTSHFFSLILFQFGSRWFIVLRGLGMLYDTFEATKKNGFLVVDPVQNDRKFMPFVVFRFQNISLHFVVLVSLPLANK